MGRDPAIRRRPLTDATLDRRSFLLAGLAGALAVATPAQALDASVATIQTYSNRLVDTMRRAATLSVRARYQALAPVITTAFDFGTMTRAAVGPAWSRATPAQQSALREAFSTFLAAYYASQIDGYSGERFNVDPNAEDLGGQKLVRTTLIKSSGEQVPINYLMRGSKVVDIYFNGTVSEIAARRAEFTSILGTGGPEALIAVLRQRSQSLLAG